MSNSHWGRLLTLTTYGESHGPAMGGIVDGMPAGLTLSEAMIQAALDQRRPGQSSYTTQRRETDQIQILSGVYQGKTTGTPIGLQINNLDAKSKDYQALKEVFRPGHAEFTYYQKYGHYDHRGGGRASARETAIWVAAGSIAQQLLQARLGVNIYAYCAQIGHLDFDWESKDCISDNPFFIPNTHQIDQAHELIRQLQRQGDSVGALVNVVAESVPAGLGEPVFGKLDAEIAHAMMSINAVKAVSIGDGFDVVAQNGSTHRDAMDTEKTFLSNHAGGILGGIATGQSIRVALGFKPTSSIRQPVKTITKQGQATEISVTGRHDPCVGIRGVPVAKAMLALTLADAYLVNQSKK